MLSAIPLKPSAGMIFFILVVFIFTFEPVSNAQSNELAKSSPAFILSTSQIASERSKAIAKLRLNNRQPLSAAAHAALVQAALFDNFISIRLEATRLLSTYPLDNTTTQALSEAWARELTTPNGDVWRNILHPISSADVHVEAANFLANLHSSPYPNHVVLAWIHELQSFGSKDAIEFLGKVRTSMGFTDKQIAKIKAVAARISRPKLREAIYALVVSPADEEQHRKHLNDFEHAKRSSDSLYAANALLHKFSDQDVPASVALVANRVMHATRNPKLRNIAATLVARSADDFSTRESRLMAALKKNNYESNISNAIVQMYGEARLQELIVRYAPDLRVPDSFKTIAINALGKQAIPGKALPENTRTALVAAAWGTSDYYLISVIRSTLNDWHSSIPWIIYLKSKDLQSRSLSLLFAACALLILGCGILVTYYLSARKFVGQRSAVKRGSSLFGWFVLSIVMLGLIAFAFLGFLGHNSAPSPRHTIGYNIPLYLGTIVYVFLAWVDMKKARSKA